MEESIYILSAFLLGLSKQWNLTIEGSKVFEIGNPDLFQTIIMPLIGGREKEQYNKSIAELFGIVVTKVKTFPTSDGSWIILDKHTKRMLHKGIKNENEVNALCSKNNYVR